MLDEKISFIEVDILHIFSYCVQNVSLALDDSLYRLFYFSYLLLEYEFILMILCTFG